MADFASLCALRPFDSAQYLSRQNENHSFEWHHFICVSLQFGSNSFYPKFLNETRPRKQARRRSLPLATQQKSFLCISDFARAGFFLLKGKENFFAGFCSQRAGRRDWPLFFARTRRNSPHTPLPPCSCGDGRKFWRRRYSFPCPTTRARKSLRNSL